MMVMNVMLMIMRMMLVNNTGVVDEEEYCGEEIRASYNDGCLW